MVFVKNYYYSLTTIALAVTVIMLMAPENTRIIKYVRWITSLCVILVLIVPILNFSGEITFNNFKNGQTASVKENGQELIINEFKAEISDIVCELINDKFNINSSDINIDLNAEDIENISINKISLNLNVKSRFLKSDVEKYLKEKFLCEINIYD